MEASPLLPASAVRESPGEGVVLRRRSAIGGSCSAEKAHADRMDEVLDRSVTITPVVAAQLLREATATVVSRIEVELRLAPAYQRPPPPMPPPQLHSQHQRDPQHQAAPPSLQMPYQHQQQRHPQWPPQHQQHQLQPPQQSRRSPSVPFRALVSQTRVGPGNAVSAEVALWEGDESAQPPPQPSPTAKRSRWASP